MQHTPRSSRTRHSTLPVSIDGASTASPSMSSIGFRDRYLLNSATDRFGDRCECTSFDLFASSLIDSHIFPSRVAAPSPDPTFPTTAVHQTCVKLLNWFAVLPTEFSSGQRPSTASDVGPSVPTVSQWPCTNHGPV